MGDELAIALTVEVEMLKKEIKLLKTRELILVATLEGLKAISIYRADELLTEFIEIMLAMGPDHEKD